MNVLLHPSGENRPMSSMSVGEVCVLTRTGNQSSLEVGDVVVAGKNQWVVPRRAMYIDKPDGYMVRRLEKHEKVIIESR